MENLTALNIFNLLPSDPQSADLFKAKLEDEFYENGNIYAHELLRTVNATVKMLNEIVKNQSFKDNLYHEMSDKKEIYDGYTITQKYRNIYHYEMCNDDTYNVMIQKFDGLKNQIKQREKFLQSIPEDGTVIPETGEIINKAIASSSLSFTVNFKKPKAEKVEDHFDNIFK